MTRVDAGLSASEVRGRVAAGQVNTVARRTSRPTVDILRANVFTRFNAVLGGLFALIMVVGPVQDGLFGFVILVNTAIGVVQELRAKRTLDRLAIVAEARPRVCRDGAVVEVPVNQVVLDELIVLGPGDQLVVDGTVRSAEGLEIDESLLTGEADPVRKRPDDPVLSGSFVVAGSGAYRATRVGPDAYAARLAQRASSFALASSELRTGIDRLLRWITWLFVPVGALTVYGQIHANHSVADTVRGVVAALVPMVPEGLVLLTSLAFAVGAIRLGRRACLVRELPAIEGLARVDVVCTDKTGTLTETGMRVRAARGPGGAPLDSRAEPALAALAATDPRPSMRAVAAAWPHPPDWRPSAVAPFSSATKWSGATFAGRGSWLLGAPDVLLPAGHPVVAEADELSRQGLRVLLLACSDRPVDAPDAPGPVMPVALIVLEQRIRSDARSTVDYFAAQGVAVKVVSGDNPKSVGAVAAALDLPGADQPVDARDLPADPAELAARVVAGSAFGRIDPDGKQRLVAALRADGHTVAMTGDGVNDVLALKAADIGVAMGSGSPATRAVAQLVLLDNRFAGLPRVVAEGRRVIGNIERVAHLFLIKTVYSTLLSVLVGFARLPFPFLPRQLTLIGTLTIGVPAFFLALAPNTERARGGFLRRVLRLAVPAGAVAAAATFGCYYTVRLFSAAGPDQQRTAVSVTLFLVALWALVVIARPLAWWKAGLVAAMAAGFGLVLLLPVGRWFFALDPGDTPAMLIALLVAVVGMAALEVAVRLTELRS
jgi:cation-transporting ATPase E